MPKYHSWEYNLRLLGSGNIIESVWEQAISCWRKNIGCKRHCVSLYSSNTSMSEKKVPKGEGCRNVANKTKARERKECNLEVSVSTTISTSQS